MHDDSLREVQKGNTAAHISCKNTASIRHLKHLKKKKKKKKKNAQLCISSELFSNLKDRNFHLTNYVQHKYLYGKKKKRQYFLGQLYSRKKAYKAKIHHSFLLLCLSFVTNLYQPGSLLFRRACCIRSSGERVSNLNILNGT